VKGFDDALGITLGIEGGVSSNPADRGGQTKLGITQDLLDSVKTVSGLLPDNVAALTAAQARVVYQLVFWNPLSCDSFPWPVSLFLFDSAVNHGPRNAAKMLQRALWVTDDGIIGPGTKSAPMPSVPEVGYAMLTLRRVFYATISASDPTQAVFLKGWLNRVDRLREELDPEPES
jgi:lysozyme family protein